MARRRRGRNVSGVLVLDKPTGISSSDAVQQVKRLYGAAKVGHTGSLDPLATGVLPLCFGEATKFSQFLLGSDKRYWTRIKLGIATTTSDADGDVLSESDPSHITADDVEAALSKYQGDIQQVPSMYSALKHNGQPLYKLARQGIEVEREARAITVYKNELVKFEPGYIELVIHCSKGTYIRTIADELGKDLGVGGHVVELRRLSAGPFREDQALSIEFLENEREKGSLDGFLRPTSSAVGQWPELKLTDATAFYLRQGQPVLVPHAPTSGWVRLCEESNDQKEHFLGVGEVLDDGRIAPRRLVSSC
ncbi:MAG: tRNA pseudouridine(55) synthase TruB [Pseudomonadota bacterium]